MPQPRCQRLAGESTELLLSEASLADDVRQEATLQVAGVVWNGDGPRKTFLVHDGVGARLPDHLQAGLFQRSDNLVGPQRGQPVRH